MPTISEALAIAVANYEAGRLQIAEEVCRRILAAQPDHAEALYRLGSVLHRQGRLAEAIACYGRVLELAPQNAEAQNNLGNARKDQGDMQAAAGCYGRAVALNPASPEYQCNLGAALHMLGRLDDAIACYRRALELKPDHAETYNNLGIALQVQGQLEPAKACFVRALELKPGYAFAEGNLGNAWMALGRPAEAVACYGRSLALNPNDANMLNQLAHALHVQGKLDQSIACYRQALKIQPGLADACNNLGNALRDAGQHPEAIACYRRAIELSPDRPMLWSALLYALQFCPEYSPATILEEHRRWSQRFAEPLRGQIVPHTNDRSPDRPLRIGYISPDFRRQAQAFFTVPLLTAHDRQRFEVFCYADVVRADDVTARLQTCASQWRNIVGLSEEQVAQRVREDRIDILVDLSMHMDRNHLLAMARKPAPIQVTWLAYQGTTGLAAIDYRLTDPWIDPPGVGDEFYAEQSVRLPDAFWCYDPLDAPLDVGPLPALARGQVTFGSLNNFCKVGPALLPLWAALLRAVERSRLILLAGEGSHRERTVEFFAREGVSRDRIAFVAPQPRDAYLKLYQGIDIALDTLPYNGQTTTLDALWMGVPVLSLMGQTAVGRAGLSLLSNLGTPEWVAREPQQFLRLAAEMAGDLAGLAALRSSLRARLAGSPLMDAPRFARNVEAAYRQMWRRWCG